MKRFIVVGVLVFLVVLVATFPARVAYRWLDLPDLQLTGISGSIWSGQADEGLAVDAYLRDIRWAINPAALLTGKLSYSAEARPVGGMIATDIAVGLGGALEFENLTGSIPLALVHTAFQDAGMTGDLSMEFERLVLANGVVTDARGFIAVENAFAPLLSSAPLGSYRADISSRDSAIVGIIDDTAGVLDVEGELRLEADRSYSLVGNVSARPDAPRTVSDQLVFLGSPDANGMRPFRFEGSL